MEGKESDFRPLLKMRIGMQTSSTIRRLVLPVLFVAVCLWAGLLSAPAQQSGANASQTLVFAGLRSVASKGSIQSISADAAGDLFLLFDQGDGIRILKVSGDGSQVLEQAHLGNIGDYGAALALDASGKVYIAGTSTSGVLAGTSGAAIPNAVPGTTNAFVAGFDSSLTPLFLTFTGGTRIAATALAATADAVFVAGITYGSDLPVTPAAVQRNPASNTTQNGFIERFSSDGSTLVYATYLTGASGDTTPAAIAADGLDDLWIVGSTSASGFATASAVVPVMLSSTSGFLTRLAPVGDSISFSTFVPGAGLNSVALDSTGQQLLLSGAVALGQFPVDSVAAPLVPATYQVLLRMPLDGSFVSSGSVLAPGLQSILTPAANGAAWIAGDFSPGSAPLLPQSPLATIGNGYAVRFSPGVGIDQTLRFGGLANQQQTYASVPLSINGLAVDRAGSLFVAGAAQPTASAALLQTETYDVPLRGGPTEALPSILRDAESSSSLCSGSLCAGSGGFLAKVDPAGAAPALTFSMDDLPFFTLRNLGSGEAQNLQLHSFPDLLVTNCPSSLAPGAGCDGLLSGGNGGTLTASASETADTSVSYGTYPPAAPSSSLVFYPKELDFGLQTSSSMVAALTVTISNLGSSSETFVSTLAASPQVPSFFNEQSSDCANALPGPAKILPSGSTCHITIAFTATPDLLSDGFIQSEWTIGTRQVFLTGYSQSASLSVSAGHVDFGTQFQGGLRLPRYLYLSNGSTAPQSHLPVSLPSSSPFVVSDACPAVLQAQSVCRIRLDYLSPSAPSTDTVTLNLDQSLQVLVSGLTQPAPNGGGRKTTPPLTVSPLSATFGNAVAVTQVADTPQNILLTNTGTSVLVLSFSITGDFSDTTSCGPALPPASTCSVAVNFAPSQPGTRQGLLTITSGTSTKPLQVALSGAGSPLFAAGNGTLAFPEVPVGQPLVQFYKITQALPSLSVIATGPFRVALIEDHGFGHGSPPPSVYAASSTGSCLNCWLAVSFQPPAAGVQAGTLTLSSAPNGAPYVLVLNGFGLLMNGVVAAPAVVEFGGIPVHSSSGSSLVTVTNAFAPASPVTVSAPFITGDFVILPPPNGGPMCSGDLPPGASCFVGIAFSPTQTGPALGALTFTTSSGNLSVQLNGNATQDPGLAVSPLALVFAGPSASAAQSVTLTNTGLSPLNTAAPATSTSSFAVSTACAILIPGTSCSVQLTFIPGADLAAGTLTIPVISVSRGTPQTATYTVALSGEVTASSLGLYLSPNSQTFGPIPTSTSGPIRRFTLTNSTPHDLSLASVFPHDYALSGPPCTFVAAASSCDFQLQFVPLVNGNIAGSVVVQATPADGSAPITSLAYAEGFGVGNGALTISGAPLVNGIFNFGPVPTGQSSTQLFTLSNQNPPGSPDITVRRISSPPPFLSTTTCGVPIPVGASCTVSVTYAPAGVNPNQPGSSDLSTLTIESDAESSPDSINLAGQPTGPVAPGAAPILATFSLSQGSLTFPPTAIGDISSPQIVSLTNTGSVPLQVTSITSTADFSVQTQCALLPPGGTCSILVASTPQTPGVHLAALEISSNAASSLEFISLVSVTQPASLTVVPASLAFGSVPVGTTSTLPLQVTNTNASPVIFTQVSASGDYAISGNCPLPGAALAAQTSCTLQVTFSPTLPGLRPGTLTLASAGSPTPVTVPLSGSGSAPHLVLSSPSLSFGSVSVGGAASLTLTLLNQGTAALTALSATSTGDYAVSLPCSATLDIGASCSMRITFSPVAPGARSGVLTITSSDPSSPAIVPLSGLGLSAADFSLTVDGGSSANRSVASGQPATFNLLLTPDASFSGVVALTCNALQPVPSASCSLLPALLTLNGSSAFASVTINTIDSGGGMVRLTPQGPLPRLAPTFAVFLPASFFLFRRRSSQSRLALSLVASLLAFASLAGCGGGTSSNVHLTPPGTYLYNVSASSTSGPPVSHTVTLTVIVTSR